MKYILIIVIAALWFTRPSDAIERCETINKTEYCQILNAE
ncbi:hypothetical protein [Vibrio phage Artemius]|nr:hypothetical protein [Vibrio phage Artemius]